jgi:hypothetical protein
MSLPISHPVLANTYYSNHSVRRPAVQASERQCQHPALVPIWQRDPVWQRGSFWQLDHVGQRDYVWQRDPFFRQLRCYTSVQRRVPYFGSGGWQHWSSALPDCRRWSRSWDGHGWIARCFVGEHHYSCTLLDTCPTPAIPNSNPSHAPDVSWTRMLPESPLKKIFLR